MTKFHLKVSSCRVFNLSHALATSDGMAINAVIYKVDQDISKTICNFKKGNYTNTATFGLAYL